MLICADTDRQALTSLLKRYGLQLDVRGEQVEIEGSYWGEPEAGLVGSRLFARPDTPVHSVLHESCHFICMDEQRREGLHTNAGGDFAEENAVCYLQILLADELPTVGRVRMCTDMDEWGYTFRLGSAAAWFDNDAAEVTDWLRGADIIDGDERPTWRIRQS